MTEVVKTLKLRVKDKHAALLQRMACQVNTVWNFVNETSARAIRERGIFMSAYDLQKYTAGYSLCDDVLILASTIEAVSVEYVARRRQSKKARLSWRVSDQRSSKRSLGWVPMRAIALKLVHGQVRYAGHLFSLWDSYDLSKYEMRSGSFTQDHRGRWYFNVAVRVSPKKSQGTGALGIDLGLKAVATASDGQRLGGGLFRAAEARLATAQRAGRKKQVRTAHAKVKNQRGDAMHKFSTKLVAENGAIFVGDVSSQKLVKTKFAKSTLDAGWGMLKTMLEYKCQQAGVVFEVVNESYTTQTCNACGVIAGPKGRAGLNKRSWVCACGAVHDRDVNAALNIRARGLASLAEGARNVA